MIVAAYVNRISSLLPVDPVNRIERLTPQGRQSRRSRQEEYSFASMFAMMMKPHGEESKGFDSRA